MRCKSCGQTIPIAKMSPLGEPAVAPFGLRIICDPNMPDGYILAGGKAFRILTDTVEELQPKSPEGENK